MRRISLLFFAFLPLVILAQEAEWLDYSVRSSKYPDADYLTAFASEEVPKKTEATVVYEKLNEITKSQLIESIVVSIKSQTELNISTTNAQTDEAFKRSSQSFSSANLVGMNVNNHFDKKKRLAYSFSYVKISELISYNQQLVARNSRTIQDNLSKMSGGSKVAAAEMGADNEKMLMEMAQAISVLRALGTDAAVDNLAQLSRQNQQAIDAMLSNGKVQISVISTLLTKRLSNQASQLGFSGMVPGVMGYATSGVESSYTRELVNQIGQTLSQESGIALQQKRKARSASLAGSFRSGDGKVTFAIGLEDENKRQVIGAEVALAVDNIHTGSFDLLPPNYGFVDRIDEFALKVPASFEVKSSALLDQPLKIQLTHPAYSVASLPVLIAIDQYSSTVMTDENGQASFFVPEKNVELGQEYQVDISLDLAAMLQIDSKSAYYRQVANEHPLDEQSVKLSIKAPVVYFDSDERGLDGNALKIPLIAPAIKAALSELSFTFTEDLSQADYHIKVVAATREGQVSELATIAYLDATVSCLNISSNKEIYKNSYSDVKGVASSMDVAANKAYQKGKADIADDLAYEFEYNQ